MFQERHTERYTESGIIANKNRNRGVVRVAQVETIYRPDPGYTSDSSNRPDPKNGMVPETLSGLTNMEESTLIAASIEMHIRSEHWINNLEAIEGAERNAN